MRRWRVGFRARGARRGFTRIEAVATIAVLGAAGAALPAAVFARSAGRADVAQMNMVTLYGGIMQSVNATGKFPLAYVYGTNQTGYEWNPAAQGPVHPDPSNGYIHWSGMLRNAGYVASDAIFTSPDVLRGGAPKTNPGPNPADWEPGQINDLGAGAPAALPNDRQAPRLAFAPNAALMPRNKLQAAGSPRWAQMVTGISRSPGAAESARPEVIEQPMNTTVLTELLVLPGAGGWSSLACAGGVIKSHRPITPFVGVSAGTDVFNEPNSATIARFAYPNENDILADSAVGAGMICGGGLTELNAVGRHRAGGTAYFVMADGSVRQMTPRASVTSRAWGTRFYSITGNNSVRP